MLDRIMDSPKNTGYRPMNTPGASLNYYFSSLIRFYFRKSNLHIMDKGLSII